MFRNFTKSKLLYDSNSKSRCYKLFVSAIFHTGRNSRAARAAIRTATFGLDSSSSAGAASMCSDSRNACTSGRNRMVIKSTGQSVRADSRDARRMTASPPRLKLGTRLVQGYGAIFVRNVNASALAKTNRAKSVLDAGWSAFRTMLQYKCDRAGVWFDEVNEAYSTQTCSCCNKRTGPKGLEGLGSRITDPTKEWICSECGTGHQRDVNAAKNILAAGHGRLAGGIPVLTAQAAALQG